MLEIISDDDDEIDGQFELVDEFYENIHGDQQ